MSRDIEPEDSEVRSYHRPLDYVLKLAHVSGPFVVLQCLKLASVQGRARPMETPARGFEKGDREDRDVGLAFAQRRHLDREYVQPIVEILAELSCANRLARGRGCWPR